MNITGIARKGYETMVLLISMAGFVPKNASTGRIIAMSLSVCLAAYFGSSFPDDIYLAVFYFIISEILYIGFIIFVLPENGLRHLFLSKCHNENDAYLTYEAILGFLFFHNAVSIGYIASSSPGILFNFLNKDLLLLIVMLMFISGLVVKISAANAVSIEIYYWKDMFLGRKISDFVISGPYRYLKNPMYGIGQLQGYAIAIWYGSEYGLIAAFLNQFLLFTFYFLIEKKFIRRVYHRRVQPVLGAAKGG
jgi:protein-S-isoprenylcysteine O-methyltransferase Ste14